MRPHFLRLIIFIVLVSVGFTACGMESSRSVREPEKNNIDITPNEDASRSQSVKEVFRKYRRLIYLDSIEKDSQYYGQCMVDGEQMLIKNFEEFSGYTVHASAVPMVSGTQKTILKSLEFSRKNRPKLELSPNETVYLLNDEIFPEKFPGFRYIEEIYPDFPDKGKNQDGFQITMMTYRPFFFVREAVRIIPVIESKVEGYVFVDAYDYERLNNIYVNDQSVLLKYNEEGFADWVEVKKTPFVNVRGYKPVILYFQQPGQYTIQWKGQYQTLLYDEKAPGYTVNGPKIYLESNILTVDIIPK